MQRICSWLSNKSFRFFDGAVRFEIMSRTSGRLSRTLTRAQHWIRHIFSHRPPTINSNKPSYAQESGRFLEIIKSRIHPQTVQICSRKSAKLYYDKMIALWHSNRPVSCPCVGTLLDGMSMLSSLAVRHLYSTEGNALQGTPNQSLRSIELPVHVLVNERVSADI